MVKRKKYSYRRRVSAPGSGKKRKAGRYFFYPVFAAVVLLCVYFGGKKLVDYAYASDNMTIKDIEITGCKNVTKSEIRELLPFKIGDSLLKIDLSDAENEIKKVKPELKDISINRRWQKVRVKLYERTPEAFLASGRDILGVDFEDRPFPLRGFMSGMKIPKIICKTDAERSELLNFIKSFKPVCKDFLDNIEEIKFGSYGDIVFITHDGALIYWGDARKERMERRFDKFRKIYVDAMSKYKKVEFIDMTYYDSGRAVVKPYNDNENQS
ncbi:MAG: FtsQ-type POTRA domain-containing protein [Endomicrobia bacterium]|nr:FtsQ-type POTRA domain-containing protein [Endomicrobiia bacterium]MCL2799618.1 FtsQ-type POTRA domain-containing protein [Endomicrobiia bacterium]